MSVVFFNYAHNIVLRPRRLDSPHGFGEVVALVTEAARLGRHVRAVGSGWSFSDVMGTHDFLVDTRRMRGIIAMSQGRHVWGHRIHEYRPGDDPLVEPDPLPPTDYPADRSRILIESLKDEVLASDRRFVEVLAGTTIRELYMALDRWREDAMPPGTTVPRGAWALPTMGGSAGQTILGAISTGTHGGDFDEPPLADMVRGILLIAPDGSQHWIERPGRDSITDPERLFSQGFRGDVARENLHYDDDWFRSVLVSFGSMGIVYSVVLEVREQYGLSERVLGTTSWNLIKGDLRTGSIFGGAEPPSWMASHPHAPLGSPHPPKARGLGIFINPYRRSDDYSAGADADRDVVVITHAALDGSRDEREHHRTSDCALHAAFSQMFQVAEFEHAGSPGDTRRVVGSLMEGLRGAAGTTGYPRAYSVLDTTSADEVHIILSLEIVISTHRGHHVDLIDELFRRFDKIMDDNWNHRSPPRTIKFAGGFNLRFTRPSIAHMAMQAPTPGVTDERFCHIEIIVAKEVDMFGAVYGHTSMENFTEEFVFEFEQAAKSFGARLHWGQYSITDGHDPRAYPSFPKWQTVRRALTRGGALRTFDNAFAARHGLVAVPESWSAIPGLVPPGVAESPLTATQGVARMPPVVARNPTTGAVDVYVLGPEGQMCRARQTAPGRFGAWEPVPDVMDTYEDVFAALRPVRRVSPRVVDATETAAARLSRMAAVYGNEWFYLFGIGRDGCAYQTNSASSSAAWGSPGFGKFGEPRCVGSPAAILGPSGDGWSAWPYLFVRSQDGLIRYVTRWESDPGRAPGRFGNWYALPALPAGVAVAGDPAPGRNANGTMAVFVRGSDGHLWKNAQAQAAPGAPFQGWEKVGTLVLTADPAVATNRDGRLELFARGSDGRLWHAPQTAPNVAFAAWEQVAPVYSLAAGLRPSVALAGDLLRVAVLDSTGHAHVLTQGRPWTTRQISTDVMLTSPPVLGVNAQGGCQAYARVDHDLVAWRAV